MRPPLPLPVTQRPAVASKPARKAASAAPANRAARKSTSTHDGTSTHKSSRRKGASEDTTTSTKDSKDAALDFAAMLAQNAAQPAAATPATPAASPAGDAAKGSDALGTDAATALLRPQGLTPAVDAGAAEIAPADGADDASAAAAAATNVTGDVTNPSEPGAPAAPTAAPISVPTELASTAPQVAATAIDAPASGVHRRDTREVTTDGQVPVAPSGPVVTDVPPVTTANDTDGPPTSGEQATGDQGATGQQQPDLAGAAAAGAASTTNRGAETVSETPMPAHTVAPTIAQVAQSLRTSGDGTSRLVIRLDPAELGPVLVSLRTRGGTVDISVRADNAGGAAAVADQRAHIQQVLAEHGLDLSSFSVSGGEASGGAGSSTADAGTSDASGDGAPNGNPGPDSSATNYADVQAQASGTDAGTGDRRAFSAPQESVRAIRANEPSSGADGVTAAPVRTIRREGTWL